MHQPVAVWLIKRDARLGDNACLAEAKRLGLEVLPLFCFEPTLLAANDTSEMHIQAQWQGVSGLRAALRRQGADVVIAHGEVVDKLAKLHALVPFSHLMTHEEIGNDLTYRRDQAIAAWCRTHQVQYQEFPQSSVRRGGVNRDRLQQVWKNRIALVPPLPTGSIDQSSDLRNLAAQTTFPRMAALRPNRNWQPVSEADAQATLAEFLQERGVRYRGGISSPNTAMTAGSRLSVHLAWGTVTTRQVWHAVQARLAALDPDDPHTARWRKSLSAFVSRLHWRDHFAQRLESEPELEFRSIHPAFRNLPYEDDHQLYLAWCEGRTGYPLVDAVMRCLATTGFINFRMRAMVVSFACHVLHLDWRMIHPHLARVFRDYDPGIHLNQLQMQAGVVGWNAIRVYNPTKQLADWDANCQFVKQWVPELRAVSPETILQGEDLPHYPERVVPFAPRAKQMIDALYAIRKMEETKLLTPAVYRKHGSRKKEQVFRPKRTSKKGATRPIKPPAPGLFDLLEDE